MPIRPEMRARYPKDWALRSRFVRFVRARGRCEWCGAPHGFRVWRHPDNPRSWWAQRDDGGGHKFVVWTCAGAPLLRPTNFVGGAQCVLTTAHVYDDRPEACSLLNLAALCQHCHNGHDMKKRRQGTIERRRAQLAIGDLFAPDDVIVYKGSAMGKTECSFTPSRFIARDQSSG